MLVGTIALQELSVWRLFHRGVATAHAAALPERAVWIGGRAG